MPSMHCDQENLKIAHGGQEGNTRNIKRSIGSTVRLPDDLLATLQPMVLPIYFQTTQQRDANPLLIFSGILYCQEIKEKNKRPI